MKRKLLTLAAGLGLMTASAVAFAASHACCGDLAACCMELLACCL